MSSNWVIPPLMVRVRVLVYDHDCDSPKYGPPDIKLKGNFCQTTLITRVVEDLCNQWNYERTENTWRVGRIVDRDGDPFDPLETIWGGVANSPIHVIKAPPLHATRDVLPRLEPKSIVPMRAYSDIGLDAPPQPQSRPTKMTRAPQAERTQAPSQQASSPMEIMKTPRGAVPGLRPQLESSPMDLMSSPTNMVAAARSAFRFGSSDFIDLTINDSDADSGSGSDSDSDEVNANEPITAPQGSRQLFALPPPDHFASRLGESNGAPISGTDAPKAESWTPPGWQLSSAARYSDSPSPSKRADIDLTWMDDSSDDELPVPDPTRGETRRGAVQGIDNSTAKGKYSELHVNMGLAEEAKKTYDSFLQTSERPGPATKLQDMGNKKWLKRSNGEIDTTMSDGRENHYGSSTAIPPDTGASYSLEGPDLHLPPAPPKPRGMMLTPIRLRGKRGQERKKQAVHDPGKDHLVRTGQSNGALERPAKRKSEDELDVLLKAAREEADKQSLITRMEREKSGLMLSARSWRGSKRHRSESFRPPDESAAIRNGPVEGDMGSVLEDVEVRGTGCGATSNEGPSSLSGLLESHNTSFKHSAAQFQLKKSSFSVLPSQAKNVGSTGSAGPGAIKSNLDFVAAIPPDERKEQPQGGDPGCLPAGDQVLDQWMHGTQQDDVHGDDRMQLDPPDDTGMPVSNNSQLPEEQLGCATSGACPQALDRALKKYQRRKDRQKSVRDERGCTCPVHNK